MRLPAHHMTFLRCLRLFPTTKLSFLQWAFGEHGARLGLEGSCNHYAALFSIGRNAPSLPGWELALHILFADFAVACHLQCKCHINGVTYAVRLFNLQFPSLSIKLFVLLLNFQTA